MSRHTTENDAKRIKRTLNVDLRDSRSIGSCGRDMQPSLQFIGSMDMGTYENDAKRLKIIESSFNVISAQWDCADGINN